MTQNDSLSNPTGGGGLLSARLRRALAKASSVVFNIASNLVVNNNKSSDLTTTVKIVQNNQSTTQGIAQLLFQNNNTTAGIQLTNSAYAGNNYAGMLEMYGDGIVLSGSGNPVIIEVPTSNGSVLSFLNATGYSAGFYHGQAATVDTVDTRCGTVAMQAGTTYLLEARIVARRTGGSAGTADDGASFIRRAMYTTKAGTITLTGAAESTFDRTDVAGYAARFSIVGGGVAVVVNGNVNTNIGWNSFIMVSQVS